MAFVSFDLSSRRQLLQSHQLRVLYFALTFPFPPPPPSFLTPYLMVMYISVRKTKKSIMNPIRARIGREHHQARRAQQSRIAADISWQAPVSANDAEEN